jgi:hypothetical protein
MPGAEADVAKYAKNEGWFQCVSAGTTSLPTSARISDMGSPVSGGEEGS